MSAISAPAGASRRVTRAPALRVLEHELMVYRRTWRGSLFTTFLSPVLFLAAMGLGLGALVDRNSPAALAGVSYLAFLAPGLLAAQSMQTAAFESTYPVMGGITWAKTFDAILATPVTVRDLVIGKLGWITVRLSLASGVFLIVMTLFGAVLSTRAILAWPSAVLTGFSFAAPIAAFAATRRNDNAFAAMFRFLITPMFLFSGTFFPIEQLPELLRPVAYLTPLYHGVALTRGLALGTLDAGGFALHAGVLLAVSALGVLACMHTFRARLVK